MNTTRRIIAIGALAALFALGACGGNNANNGASPSPSPTTPAEGGAGAANEVTIKASNWKFEPAEIRVKAGDTLKLTLENTQGAHGIEVSDLNVSLKNNETKEIKLDQPGSYEFHCSIQCGQGHDAMTGFIVVE
ncbi:cupredoxin domain-containing protein [Cohnella cellulosilytica]|uniref:Cupredoxin domain-containing protein n=1 Tax=Cohnella cellulosilytica TaxID=986710 RepID=A0ABW2FAQ8_9BACL